MSTAPSRKTVSYITVPVPTTPGPSKVQLNATSPTSLLLPDATAKTIIARYGNTLQNGCGWRRGERKHQQRMAMQEQKYSVNQHLLETILVWVKSGEIAIPEIQRPFVWDAVQVRDLMDSLYQGYPVGYLIAWRNPTVRLKDGTRSEGKRILIDGQQRVTALMAAVLGYYVLTKDY